MIMDRLANKLREKVRNVFEFNDGRCIFYMTIKYILYTSTVKLFIMNCCSFLLEVSGQVMV